MKHKKPEPVLSTDEQQALRDSADAPVKVPGPGFKRTAHSVTNAPNPGHGGGGKLTLEIEYTGVIASGPDLVTLLGDAWWHFCKQNGLNPESEAKYVHEGCQAHAYAEQEERLRSAANKDSENSPT